MWDWIFRQLVNNMESIKKAPIAFLLIAGIFGVIGWNFSGSRFESIIKGKDATIESKNALIEQLQARQESIRTIVFDDDGKISINMGAQRLIEDFKVDKIKGTEKFPYDFVITLRTKEHLQHIPIIHSVAANNQVAWEAERKDDKTIIWKGYWMMSNDSVKPQFKMEIYQTK